MRRPAFGSVALLTAVLVFVTAPTVNAVTYEFPDGYQGYNTYAEVAAELDAVVAAYGQGPGAIVKRFVIGQSFEGRDIWALKISDQVDVDENEPEVLAESGMHGRERLSIEMALYMVDLLTQNYGGTDTLGQRVTDIVNSREIWIIPMVNPDGAEFDIADATWHNWRKDRFDNPNTTAMGIDINRNFSFMWAGKGSSPTPGNSGYRGQFPFQSVEARVLRDFVLSRKVDGRQQIRAIFNWHSYGEFVMWPYGYTKEDVPPTMTVDDHDAFVALGTYMASLNGYTPRQGSDSYLYSGDFPAWAYGEQRAFIFTFEMYPTWECEGCGAFHPPDSVIEQETTRNLEAVLYLLEQADCPYRAAGTDVANCGPLHEDFEISRGWTVNPARKDTASRGRWELGIPKPTHDASGPKQLGTTTSGQANMTTGRTPGKSVGARDLDGGTTSLQSPLVELGGGEWALTFNYTFAHNAAATASDFLRVSVLDGATRTVIWTVNGNRANRNAEWTAASASLTPWQDKSVRLLFEARDGAPGNIVEAALDDVRVRRP